jgi:hypothetical protein
LKASVAERAQKERTQSKHGDAPFLKATADMQPLFVNSPQTKGIAMLRTLTKLAQFWSNYRYYRLMGIHVQEAWNLARLTLPD